MANYSSTLQIRWSTICSPLTDHAGKQGNMLSIHIACLIVSVTGRYFRITDAFADVIGAVVGIAKDFAPACSFRLLGVSIPQIEAAAAEAAMTKPAGLARTSKRCAPHHYPLGGHSGAVICLLCAISANYYLCSTR